MRPIFAILAVATAILSATPASAERRMFIVANNANGYGIDRCLASGASCGAAIAAAYCRSREFNQAVSYRKVQKNDITGAVPCRRIARLQRQQLRGICRHRVHALSAQRRRKRSPF
jgi:hypothetical protein